MSEHSNPSGVPVDAVEDFGGPEPGGESVHGRADAGVGTEAAPTGTLDQAVARRPVTHPADERAE